MRVLLGLYAQAGQRGVVAPVPLPPVLVAWRVPAARQKLLHPNAGQPCLSDRLKLKPVKRIPGARLVITFAVAPVAPVVPRLTPHNLVQVAPVSRRLCPFGIFVDIEGSK